MHVRSQPCNKLGKCGGEKKDRYSIPEVMPLLLHDSMQDRKSVLVVF